MMKKLILILMILGVVSSCSNEDDNRAQNINMRINHFQNTGIAEGMFLTLLVQEGDDIGTDNWTKFYSNIQGFDYEPGTIYNLSVDIEEIDDPPLDGSSLKYTLKEVISTQEVDKETLFDIDLKIHGSNFVTTNDGFELLDEIKIDCNNLCDELETMLQEQDFVVGTFKRVSRYEIKLMGLQ